MCVCYLQLSSGFCGLEQGETADQEENTPARTHTVCEDICDAGVCVCVTVCVRVCGCVTFDFDDNENLGSLVSYF